MKVVIVSGKYRQMLEDVVASLGVRDIVYLRDLTEIPDNLENSLLVVEEELISTPEQAKLIERLRLSGNRIFVLSSDPNNAPGRVKSVADGVLAASKSEVASAIAAALSAEEQSPDKESEKDGSFQRDVFASVMEVVNAGYLLLDTNGVILDVDRSARRIVGEDLSTGKSLLDVFDIEGDLKSAFQADREKSVFARHRISGRRFTLSIRRAGNVLLCVVREEVDVERLRRELFECRESFRALNDSGAFGIAIVRDNRILSHNGKLAELVGKASERLSGRSFLLLFHEDDRKRVEDLIASGGRLENVRVRSSSGTRYVALTAVKSGDSVLCTLFDVTQYVLERDEERKIKDAYRTVYELSPYPIVVHDRGKVVMYNRKAKEFFKMQGDMTGINLMDFMPPESKSKFLRKIESLAMGFDTCPVEEIRFNIDGDERETLINCRAISLGGRSLVISVIVDLTESVRVSRLLRIIHKINTSLVEIKSKKLVIQHALKELEREYHQAFAVMKARNGFEVVTPSEMRYVREVENECVKRAMETHREIIVKRNSHPEECVYRELHDEYETAVFPLQIGNELFGFLTIIAGRIFLDAEIKLLRTLVGTLAYVYHKSELEEVRLRAIEQLKRNIHEFSIVLDRIKNPLAVIYGYCELTDEIQDVNIMAAKIREEVERINDLLKQLERDWEASEDLLDFIEGIRR
ncbi:MAG: PAS domain S-box protein [Archaeoglobi archaeon]|nr:PAS domain S-box protein [Archaeoglobi archaeon]